jgi:malonate transporter and related proteins
MVGVLIGFAIIAVVIAAGYLVARIDLLGEGAQRVLSRLAFFVLQPALLFEVIARADVRHLFSSVLPVSAISAVAAFAVFAAVAAIRRRPVVESVVGAMSSGYVNANNIGLPVSVYVLGDASSSVPVILLQLIVFSPIVLATLDIATGSRASVGRMLLRPLTNPIIIGAALGFIVALTGVKLPDPVLAPFELVGAAAVPVVLLGFGMSLRGRRALAPGTERPQVVLATVLKLAVMPVVAWAVGAFAFHLHGHALFAVVALAALPTAQNVFNYAQRYGAAVVLARDVVLVTTVLSILALLVVAFLLAPG